jgi:hypothetical protein
VPSPAVVRSPDWTKKTKSGSSHCETSEPISPTRQNSYIPPHMRPTFEDAINPKYIPSAKVDGFAMISTYPREDTTPQKSDKIVMPDTQAGQSVGIAKGSDPRLYIPPHRRQNSEVAKDDDTTTVTTRSPSPSHTKSITGHSQSQKSEALARQASPFKSSVSSSSGASAWKNHRAIIEQSDRALNKEHAEAAAKDKTEYLKLSFKDKWIPAVVENGNRILKKAITITVSGMTSPATSSGGHDSAPPKPQDVLEDSSKPVSSSNVDKINESASVSGYILCDWGELTDEESRAMTGKNAEAGGGEIPELNTDGKADAVITDGPAAVKDNRTEPATVGRSGTANGNTSEVAIKNQVQNQDTQTSNLGVTTDAVSASSCVMSGWGNKFEDITNEKPEFATSNNVTEQDAQTLNLAVSHTIPKISNSPGCSIISNGEKFLSAKAEAAVDVKAELGTPTKAEATSRQVLNDGSKASSVIMNAITLPPASQGGKLATSWEEFTCGRGNPANFNSYRVQKHPSHNSNFANDAFELLKPKEFTDRNPEVVASERDHQQDSQGTKSASHTFDTIPAKEIANLKCKASTTGEDQQKASDVSDSATPTDVAALPIQSGWLASTWEEFNCGKGKPELPKSYRFQKQQSRTSGSSNIVVNALGAPVHENLKDMTQVQDRNVATRQRSENYPNAGTLNGKQGPSARVIGVHPNKHPASGSKQPSSQEANVYPPAVLRNTSNEVKRRNELESPAQFHAALVKEITDPKGGKDTIALTRTNLMERTGVAPLETDCWGIDKAVSDDGVEERDVETQNCETNKQHPSDIRNVLLHEQHGMDLWEGDRAEVDLSYMPVYITSWASNIPMIPAPVDTDCDEFKTGLSPLSQLRFEKPIAQPLCYPGETHFS